MMSLNDDRGLALHAPSRYHVDALQRACDLFHGYYMNPIDAIDAALDRDPDFVMGQVLKAGIFATATEKAAHPVIDAALERLQRLKTQSNDRERAHIDALAAWRTGAIAEATERWGRVSIDYPRDLLALQFAHLGDFYQGQSLMLRDRPARVLHAWTPDVPGHGYVRSMFAFGLEESGQYADAEAAGRTALDANPRDPWAVHAVAHVYEMTHRVGDGIAWLEGRANDWATDNLFAFHNWWHLALYHLDRGDAEAALQLYDAKIRPAPSETVLEMVDASALLWRLHLRSVDVGDRWQELATAWTATIDDGIYAFNDLHAAMALIGAGRSEQAKRLLRTLERAAAGSDTNATMTRDVGLPAARAFVAFADGRYDDALDALLPVLPIAHRFGGSHAQRDLLHLTALEAALRGSRRSAARALAAQRLAAKPASPHARWLAERAKLSAAARQ